MNTVLDHMTAALAALDAELAHITEARNATAALIEQLRTTAPAPDRPLTSPATGQAARTGDGARSQRSARTAAASTRPKADRQAPAQGPDYQAIAREITAVRAAGQAVRPTLAARHGVPPTTINNWITKCRQLGLLADAPTPATTTDASPTIVAAEQGLVDL